MAKKNQTRRRQQRRSKKLTRSRRQYGGDEIPTYYEALGVSMNANTATIRKAYLKLALEHHPNKGGDEETFKMLQAVYETLTDPEQRAAYNAELVASQAQNSVSDPGSPYSPTYANNSWAEKAAAQAANQAAYQSATQRVREGTRSAVNRRRAEIAAAAAAKKAAAYSKTAADWRREAREAVRGKW